MFTKNSELWDECFKDFDEDTYCGLTVSELTDIYIEWLQAVVEESFDAENAERIIACVNACVGITNEALENGVIKEAMELFWRVSDKAILDENNQMTYKGDIIFASDKEEDV